MLESVGNYFQCGKCFTDGKHFPVEKLLQVGNEGGLSQQAVDTAALTCPRVVVGWSGMVSGKV